MRPNVGALRETKAKGAKKNLIAPHPKLKLGASHYKQRRKHFLTATGGRFPFRRMFAFVTVLVRTATVERSESRAP